MKRNSHAFFIFLLFAFLVCHSQARFLAAEQVEEKKSHDEINIQREGSFIGIIREHDLLDLMGSADGCIAEDEECLKRRMIAEAHLDYIYTQHHKP
ncbi:Putative phytosulfokines 6 [Morus notabilis]|uniref:Phytosulfokine n=1 Tax=Morus notabilis TaxID=981085 RepID=W9QHW6_9ROSA|nr:phytosulfokines 2 [Morus notabilis]EXB37771.1 Putative phytosulfokines 6 [Morus notabilis]